jgi:hypothetical protein
MKTTFFVATILSLLPLGDVRGDENSAKGPALRSPHPPYPAQAIQNRIQGSVTFKLAVKNGQITKVTATGPDLLAKPSAQWIKEHWQFKKGMTGIYTVSMDFKLPDASSGASPTPSESPDSAESPTPVPAPVPSVSPSGSSTG